MGVRPGWDAESTAGTQGAWHVRGTCWGVDLAYPVTLFLLSPPSFYTHDVHLPPTPKSNSEFITGLLRPQRQRLHN